MVSLHETASAFKPHRWEGRAGVGSTPCAAGKRSRLIAALCSLLTVCFAVSAVLCAGQEVRQEGLPVFKDDLDRDSLHRAIHRSLEFLQRIPPDRFVGEWPEKITAEEVKTSLLSFMERLELVHKPVALRDFIRSRFRVRRSEGERGNGEVLFTGYYQPVIAASLVETKEFKHPIYGKPEDLVELEAVSGGSDSQLEKRIGRMDGDRFVPYFSRHEIDVLGRLKGRGYEIAWGKDPVDLFFLHIQGSGLLRLQDSRMVPLNYAGANGRPYTSIGRILAESGKIPREKITMQRLRRYLRDHPGERDALLALNESYVFFRLGRDGPMGNLEVPLTPGRSIATDSRIYPKGALAFVVTRRPVLNARGEVVRWRPVTRFVLNQDTGSAIRGPGRVDLYFGSGPQAGSAAGAMRSSGELYLLLPKSGFGSDPP
jgi:membrane-bound lytic murein transglycosylase A